MKHKHAEILIAIAEQKEVEVRVATWPSHSWENFTGSYAKALLEANDNYEFRIKPQEVVINGFRLVDDRYYPFTNERPTQEGYSYTENIFYDKFYESHVNCYQDFSSIYWLRVFERGIGHKTQQGAINFAKARLGINPFPCSTCEDKGTIDETLGGIATSNTAVPCPDCQ